MNVTEINVEIERAKAIIESLIEVKIVGAVDSQCMIKSVYHSMIELQDTIAREVSERDLLVKSLIEIVGNESIPDIANALADSGVGIDVLSNLNGESK